jgi:hypothetical protein
VGVLIPKSNEYNYREVREQIESSRKQLVERKSDLLRLEEAILEDQLCQKLNLLRKQDVSTVMAAVSTDGQLKGESF